MARPAKPEFEVRKWPVPVGGKPWYIIGRPNGKRVRLSHPTKEQAQAEATKRNDKMRKLGQVSAAIDNTVIAMAIETANAFKPYGKTIRDALNFYLPHLKALSSTVPFSVFATEFRTECNRRLAAKELKGTRHVETLCETVKKLESRFGETPVSQIGLKELEKWVQGLTGFDRQGNAISLAIKTRNKHRGNASQIFRFAVKRKYIATNPISEVVKFRSPATEEDDAQVREYILSAEKTEKLFRAASPEIIPFLALSFFAGIRRATLEKLDWSDVRFDDKRVIVPGYKGKKNIRYRVGMLKGTPSEVGTRNQILEAASKAGIVLRSNAGRKTFISMHVAFLGVVFAASRSPSTLRLYCPSYDYFA